MHTADTQPENHPTPRKKYGSFFHMMSQVHNQGSNPAWNSIAKFVGTEASVERSTKYSSGLPWHGHLHILHCLHYMHIWHMKG